MVASEQRRPSRKSLTRALRIILDGTAVLEDVSLLDCLRDQDTEAGRLAVQAVASAVALEERIFKAAEYAPHLPLGLVPYDIAVCVLPAFEAHEAQCLTDIIFPMCWASLYLDEQAATA